MIEGWARDGLTDEQIAHNMGINVATLYVWKNKYDEISESLKKGKEVIDRQVENALLKRALGYKYKETTRELLTNKKTGCSELVVTKIVEKEVIPDTTAQIFWLKNRKPEEWRDKRVTDDGGTEKSAELLKNMQTIAEIFQHPVSDRSIDDFEEVQGDE